MKPEEVNDIMENITHGDNLGLIRNALENFEEEKKVVECCGKPMYEDVIQNMFTGGSGVVWVCLECGCYDRQEDGQYDEEILDEIKERIKEEE